MAALCSVSLNPINSAQPFLRFLFSRQTPAPLELPQYCPICKSFPNSTPDFLARGIQDAKSFGNDTQLAAAPGTMERRTRRFVVGN
jgi:hypothetical protein